MRTAEQAMSDYQFFKSHGICPNCGKEKAAPGLPLAADGWVGDYFTKD